MSVLLDELKAHALSATRELMMAVEFAEQADEAIQDGAFRPASDTEIDSAEGALVTVRSLVIEMEEKLTAMRAESESEVAS